MDLIFLFAITLPILGFIAIYFSTGRLTTALGVLIPLLIFSLATVFVVPVVIDMLEEEDIQTLDITEVIDSVKSGEIAQATSNLILFPANNSITNITIDFDSNAPIPQHFEYNEEEQQYELQDTDLKDYTKITFFYNNQTYTINYTDVFTLNNTLIDGLFPITNDTTINVTLTFYAPSDNFTSASLFVFTDDVEITYDYRPEEPESNIIDIIFGDDSFFGDWFWVFLLLFTMPLVFWIFSSFIRYRPRKYYIPSYPSQTNNEEKEKTEEEKTYMESKYGKIKKKRGDYTLLTLTTADKALEKSKEYRDQNHWTKIINYSKTMGDNFDAKRCCAVYISNWSMNDTDDKGHPRWK